MCPGNFPMLHNIILVSPWKKNYTWSLAFKKCVCHKTVLQLNPVPPQPGPSSHKRLLALLHFSLKDLSLSNIRIFCRGYCSVLPNTVFREDTHFIAARNFGYWQITASAVSENCFVQRNLPNAKLQPLPEVNQHPAIQEFQGQQPCLNLGQLWMAIPVFKFCLCPATALAVSFLLFPVLPPSLPQCTSPQRPA